MSAHPLSDLCRVTIVAPRRRADLAIPCEVPLSHLVPTLLRALGQELADQGLGHSGWVLQRLEGPALDLSRTLSELRVYDGELLFFRPRAARLPDPVFDDVADVIATGIREGTDRWGPAATRGFGLAAGVALLLAGAAALAYAGPPWALPAASAAGVAAVLAAAGIALSRAAGDAGAGSVLGYCAVVYGLLGGLLAPAGEIGVLDLGAPHLLAGFGTAALVAVVAGMAIVEGLANFLGIALAALVGVACAAAVLAAPDAPPAGLAAVSTSLCLACSALIPSVAFRLARLPLPSVPANAEELRRDTLPLSGPTVLRRTADADRFATGLVLGIGLVTLVSQGYLAAAGGWLATTASLVTTAVVLLRARVFNGRLQRGWLLFCGLAGAAILGLRVAATGPPEEALPLVALPLAITVTIVIGMAMWLPGHKPTPFWGRAADIADLALLVILIPLAVGVLNVFSWVRGLSG